MKEKIKMPKKIYFIIVIIIFLVLFNSLLFIIEFNVYCVDIISFIITIIAGISSSIAASGIWSIVSHVFKDDENEKLEQKLRMIEARLQRQDELYDSGIISIHPKAHFDSEVDYWNKIIKNTNKRLDLTGHSISNWFKKDYREIFENKIKEILESGNVVNIILSDCYLNYSNLYVAYD